MSEKSTFKCPKDGNPIATPLLTTKFRFPNELAPSIELIEGRFNTAVCPLCHERTAVLTVVIVRNPDELAVAVVVPRPASLDSAIEQRLTSAGYRLIVCRDYNELLLAVIPWLARYINPVVQAIASRRIERLKRQEQVELVTPLFLRVFKSQIDGYLPPLFRVEDHSGLGRGPTVGKIYTKETAEQIDRLGREAARTKTLLSLLATIEARIPRECITGDVLSAVAAQCGPHPEPLSNPVQFAIGWRQEYLNAVVHAYGDKDNPRGKIWAEYIRTIWTLSKNPKVTLDPNMQLSPEIVRRTCRFGDLYDVSMASWASNPTIQSGDDIALMMQHFGWLNQLVETQKQGTLSIDPKEVDEQKLEALVKAFKANLYKRVQFNRSASESEGIGEIIGGAVTNFLHSSLQEGAFALIDEVLDEAIQAGDSKAAISIATCAAELLHRMQLFAEGRIALARVSDLVERDKTKISPTLLIRYMNETGNALRYSFDFDEALTMYDEVGALLKVAPNIADRDRKQAILERNRAIVYGQKGQFKKAIGILTDLIAKNPTDSEVMVNLAAVYENINRNDDALACLDHAVELTPGKINATARALHLLRRGWIKLALGRGTSGLQDLMECFDTLPADVQALRARVASAAINFEPTSPEQSEFIERCRSMLDDMIGRDETRDDVSLLTTLSFMYGSYLLKLQQVQKAWEIFEPNWKNFVAAEKEGDWRLSFIMGWLEHARGNYAECWPFIESALTKLDHAVPSGDEVDFAPTWLRDKAAFQDVLARIAVDLAKQGLMPHENLLTVYEFMNGREIRARLESGDENDRGTRETIQKMFDDAALARGVSLEAFFFIDGPKQIHLVNLSSAGGRIALVRDLEFDRSQLEQVKWEFGDAMKRANPANLTLLDKRLRGWEEMAQRIGAAIAPSLSADTHVCWLPGRSLTALPLHLVRLPSGRVLMEEHIVSYAPNFATLLGPGSSKRKQSDGSPTTVISVNKEADSLQFKQRAESAAHDLVNSIIRGGAHAEWLNGREADHAAVARAMRASAEIAFLCHGTTAGLDRGYGICIADGGNLPPSVLSPAELSEHARFILTWQDIEDSPALVVSVACSSGITELAPGGVRLGLEQTLFSCGAQIILSPLWDVDQASSFQWLRSLYQHRVEHPEWPIEQSQRAASLALRRQYSHPYFWAPFVINGSLNRRHV